MNTLVVRKKQKKKHLFAHFQREREREIEHFGVRYIWWGEYYTALGENTRADWSSLLISKRSVYDAHMHDLSYCTVSTAPVIKKRLRTQEILALKIPPGRAATIEVQLWA